MGVIQHSVLTGAELHVTKDDSVGQAQMKNESLADFLARRPLFYDDFHGSILDDQWTLAGTGGVLYSSYPHSVSINAGPVVSNTFRIDFGGKITVKSSSLPKFLFKLITLSTTDEFFLFALYWDTNNYIAFRVDTNVGPNWLAVCRAGGVETVVDTGIAVANTPTKFKIDVTQDGAEVKFYIDDVLKATITTNIFSATFVEPRLEVITRTGAYRAFQVDYVIIHEDRGVFP